MKIHSWIRGRPAFVGLRVLFTAFAILSWSRSFSRAADVSSEVSNPAIEAVCSELEKKGLLNGVVLVADGEAILHHKAYGVSNVEHGTAHTFNSRFMVASVTKVLTATAVLQAVEQGKLDLKKPVSDYLTELRGTPAGNLTAHELLSHSGGMPASVEDQIEFYPKEAFVVAVKSASMNPEGKGKFSYQNENFMLLVLLLERVCGADFATILQRQIFDPLAMKDSGVNLGGPVVSELVPGYANKSGAWSYPPLNNLSQTFGAGCIYSTTADLLKFLRAVERRQILKPESMDLIREPKAGPYSYGWFTRQMNGKRFLAAFGKMPGYSSLAAVHDDGRSFVVLNNITDCPVTPLLQRLLAASEARPATAPTP